MRDKKEGMGNSIIGVSHTFLYKCVEKKNIDFNISNYRNSFVYGKMITKEAVLCDHSL